MKWIEVFRLTAFIGYFTLGIMVLKLMLQYHWANPNDTATATYTKDK